MIEQGHVDSNLEPQGSLNLISFIYSTIRLFLLRSKFKVIEQFGGGAIGGFTIVVHRLTLTRPIGLPPHAPVAQKTADQR